MYSIIEYFGCGNLHESQKLAVEIQVNKFSDIITKVIPFFAQYQLQGVKILDFKDFCQIAHIVKDKGHLTKEGMDLIR